MPDLVRASGWTRRDFFRAAGVGSGALALSAYAAGGGTAAPAARGAGVRQSGGALPSIVVLVPALRDASALAEDFLSGLRLGLGGAARLVVDEITVRPWRAADRIGELIAREGAALAVGLLGVDSAGWLHERLPSRETVLLASSAGESIVRESMTHPSLFHHSLSDWQASWALGQWAAAHVGRRAALAASFFESGYDSLAAFRLGFEAAGGEVVLAHVTHLPPEAGAPVPLIAPLEASRPDVVFAAYSGRAAADFILAYAESGLAGRVPLLGTGFLTDERVLGLAGTAAVGITTAAAWGDVGGAASGTFGSAYAALGRGEPGAFALLGYETALLAATALGQVSAGAPTPGAMRDALAAACIAGPRGCVAMQPGAQSTLAPVFLREVRLNDGAASNVTLAELAAIGDLDEPLFALRSSMRSGWLNTYLGI